MRVWPLVIKAVFIALLCPMLFLVVAMASWTLVVPIVTSFSFDYEDGKHRINFNWQHLWVALLWPFSSVKSISVMIANIVDENCIRKDCSVESK